GSTLLMVAVTESFIVYFQLGDGDLLVVSQMGATSRPIPPDPRLLGVETTSLASQGDWSSARVFLERTGEDPPALVLALTDGYANSSPTVADPVAEFGADLWKLIRTHGLASVQDNLEQWLSDTTEKGSGDDITLGMICRLDALPPPVRAEVV